MRPVLRLQGWQVSDAADGCRRESGLRSSILLRGRGGFGMAGWTEILWFGPQAKQFMKGAGAGMPRAQGFRYVCSDSYRRQTVPGLSG
jgi:hypothetical protein